MGRWHSVQDVLAITGKMYEDRRSALEGHLRLLSEAVDSLEEDEDEALRKAQSAIAAMNGLRQADNEWQTFMRECTLPLVVKIAKWQVRMKDDN